MNQVTKEQIDAWKKEYGFVYQITIDSIDYYFKTLSRDDYLDISTKQLTGQKIDYELETVKACLLGDVDDDTLKNKSGVVTTLSEKIMLRSGFEQAEEVAL